MASEPKTTSDPRARVPYCVIPDAAERERRRERLMRRLAELDATPLPEGEREIDVEAALREDLARGIQFSDRGPQP